MSKQKAYTGIERETTALPMLQFENKYLSLFGPKIALKLPGLDFGNGQKLNFSVVGKFDASGYEADDAAILAGMDERKGGFWAGGKVEWKTNVADVSAEWLADASGYSKGQRFNLGVERKWRFGQHVMITPRLVASWQDKNYVDYYFGVRNGEARIGRAAYTGKSAMNTEFGVRSVYMFDKLHSVFLDAEVTNLATTIKDSPLVDRSTENRLFFGYLYRFQ